MKIHEYQAIELFKKAGIPVAGGQVCNNFDDAANISKGIEFPVVLKAQVLVGGRGKAGGVKVAQNEQELKNKFREIKDLKIKGYQVDQILVVRAVDINKEFYAAVTIDNLRGDVVLIASSAGGVDIEQTARENPAAIHKFYLKGQQQVDEEKLQDFIKSVFKDPSEQAAGLGIFKKLLDVFYKYDCSLVEINPLVVDKRGEFCAVDAKINFDDNALTKHPDIQKLRDLKYEDADEIEAKEKGLSFVKLDGNVGCIVNGAGLAMATMDVIKLSGGAPANFLDVGGSSNPEKVLNALKIILRNSNVKSVLINIFGGITRCDDIAQGIVQAMEQMDIAVPFIVRLTGTNEKEAKDFLATKDIITYSSMREAVNRAVELAG